MSVSVLALIIPLPGVASRIPPQEPERPSGQPSLEPEPIVGALLASGARAMRVAYLVNVYPSPTHTFIRREIHALEELGEEVQRVSIRRWPKDLPDPRDQAEATRTEVLLDGGLVPLAMAFAGHLLRRPLTTLKTLAAARRLRKASGQSPIRGFAHFLEACRMAAFCRARSIEHVHAHFGTNSTTVAMLARRLGGAPYSFTVHGPDEYDRPRQLSLGWKVAESEAAVAISSFGRSQLYRWAAFSDWQRIHVVHCALDAEWFVPEAQISARDPLRLLTIGRLANAKGQALLLQAVQRLREAGTSATLDIVGGGPMESDLKALAERLGVGEAVTFHGWLSGKQVRELLGQAGAFVLGSFAEGLPVVMMEAMATGCPVVSTRITGVPELLEDGVTGWLATPGSVDSLVQAVQRLCNSDPEERLAIARRARERVEAEHSSLTEARKLQGFFRGRDSKSGTVTSVA